MQIPVIISTLDCGAYGLKEFSKLNLRKIRKEILKDQPYLPRSCAEREILTLRELKNIDSVSISGVSRLVEDFSEVMDNLERGTLHDVFRAAETGGRFTRMRTLALRNAILDTHGTFMHAEYDKARGEIMVYSDASIHALMMLSEGLRGLGYPYPDFLPTQLDPNSYAWYEYAVRIPL